MADKEKDEGSGAGGVVGFQVPMAIQQRKKLVDGMMSAHPDLGVPVVLAFLCSLEGPEVERVGGMLDGGDLAGVADEAREHGARELVRSRVKEMVRKKPGGGGYVLYGPNKGKKHAAKPVGTFPTRLGAKRAELARFPPRDPERLKKLRKQMDRLSKSPKKRADAEKRDRDADRKKRQRGESLLRAVVGMLVKESLFREETTGSAWDERLARLSKRALQGDAKLQKLQSAIEKQTQRVLEDAFKALARAAKGAAKLKSHGVKRSPEQGKTYLSFDADLAGTAVGPFFVYCEHGVPKVEVSSEAKRALTKADPDAAKSLRAELLTAQERVLDRMEDLVKATADRDRYLSRVEDEADGLLADMTPLQLSVMRQLMGQKYRKA